MCRPRPEGDLCFELAGGDMLFGTLVALDDKQAELDIPRIGRLHVERSNIHRIYRWRGSADLSIWDRTAWPAGPRRYHGALGGDVNANVLGPDGRPIRREALSPKQAGMKNQVSS